MMKNNLTYKLTTFVTLLPEGGRRNPIAAGYRPNFLFSTVRDVYFSGYVRHVEWSEEIKPGETKVTDVEIFCVKHDPMLRKDDTFAITEGSRVVGYGVILKCELHETENS